MPESLNRAVDRPPLDLSEAVPALAGDGWRGRCRRLLENLLGIVQVRRIFADVPRSLDPPFTAALDRLGVLLEVSGRDHIPQSGPVCLVANHPLGGADALALGAICEMRRRDFHILANRMAASLPGVGIHCLPLSIMGNDAAAPSANASALRKVVEQLRRGRCIAVFPSGEVARWSAGRGIVESPWSGHVLALARRCGAAVVPVRFDAQAPAWFHLLGAVHPLVRSALIPRLALAAKGMNLRAIIGAPLDATEGLSAADLRHATLRLE